MDKFTPGPWEINTAGGAKAGQPFKVTEIYVYAPNTQDDTAICADVIDPITQEPSEANALLISAAPDLLAALVACSRELAACVRQLKDEGYITGPTVLHPLDAARAAIAKATGEPA